MDIKEFIADKDDLKDIDVDNLIKFMERVKIPFKEEKENEITLDKEIIQAENDEAKTTPQEEYKTFWSKITSYFW